jgi:monovalent cation:H+ antiporter, CPA1 family
MLDRHNLTTYDTLFAYGAPGSLVGKSRCFFVRERKGVFMQLSILLHAGNFVETENEVQHNILLFVLLLVITLVIALISRPLRLPYTLILVVVGLIIGVSPLLPDLRLDPDIVLFLFLPALLFEGAWNVDIRHLIENWLPVFLLAVPGLLLSVLTTALLLHWSLGLPWPLVLLLGAMISPTDPIAVLVLLRQLGLSDRLRTIVEGESLFNDGVGAAIFMLVLGFLLIPSRGLHPSFSFWMVTWEVLWLTLGGLALGLLVGTIVAHLLRFLDDYLIEMTVAVAVAYGVYLLGIILNTSGLLAVVGAGLVMGSYGRRTGMSERTRQVTQDIWEFLGYLANSFLFLLLGIQIGERNFIQALVGIGVALAGVVIGRAMMIFTLLPLHNAFILWIYQKKRFVSFSILLHLTPLPSRWFPIFLFSGLRGALSIALVLSLPSTLPGRELLESIVYGVVLVTLLGQGIGLRVLLPRWSKGSTTD